jgi:hypothetical protein
MKVQLTSEDSKRIRGGIREKYRKFEAQNIYGFFSKSSTQDL